MDELKKEVLHLIQENENFENLLKEISEVNGKSSGGKFNFNGVEIYRNSKEISMCADMLSRFSSDESSLVARQSNIACNVAAEIHKICHLKSANGSTGPAQDLSHAQINELNKLVDVIHDLIESNKFDVAVFARSVGHGVALPLELLHVLHKSTLCDYEQYILSNVSNPDIIQTLAKSLVLCSQNMPNRLIDSFADVLSFLIISSCDNREHHQAKKLKKVSEIVLTTLCRKNVECALAEKSQIQLRSGVFYGLIVQRGLVKPSTFTTYLSKNLTYILTYHPNIKVSQAISDQGKWTFTKVNKKIPELFHQVFLGFGDIADLMRLLKSIIDNKEVNWKLLLSFISTLLVLNSKAVPLIKDLISCYVKEGIERGCTEKLITGLLFARQACSEGAHVFPSYSDWFQEMFGPADSVLNSRKNFLFFTKLLNDLLKYENVRLVRDHVLYPPYVPSSCRSTWQEYVIMAKIKIGENSEENVKSVAEKSNENAKKAQNIITETLSAFENTGKVPVSIMEMSIFRKPFFIGIFLPSLLTPRTLPDIPDAKMKFINQLYSSGKIPKSAFDEYENGCKKEREDLLKDILVDDVEMFGDECFDSYEILCATCQNYAQKFENQEHQTINVILCQLSANLEELLEKRQEFCQSYVILKKHLSSSAQKAMEQVMMTFKRVKSDIKFSHPLVSMLLAKPQLVEIVYTYLFQNISLPNERDLDPWEYAAFLFNVALQSPTIPVVLNDEGIKVSILDLLFDELDTSIKINSHRSLLICAGYLECMQKHQKDAFVPRSLHRKIQFLAPRLCGRLQGRCFVGNLDPALAKVPDIYGAYEQHFVKHNTIAFEEWIHLESKVVPHHDIFMNDDFQRQNYYDWIIQHFLAIPIDDGGLDKSYRVACSTLLSALTNAVPSTCPSTSHLCMLLQKLSLCITSEADEEQMLPWLLQILMKYNDEDNGKFLCLFHHIYQLPPYLIFADSLKSNHSVTRPVISAVTELFNRRIKERICVIGETYSWLPLQFVLHVIKALDQVNDEVLITRVANDIPIFKASIFYHWKSIKNFANSNSTCYKKINILTQINDLYCCVKRLCESRSDAGINRNIDPWKLGLIIHSVAIENVSKNGSLANLLKDESFSPVFEAIIIYNLADLTCKFISRNCPDVNIANPSILLDVLQNHVKQKFGVQQLAKTINSMCAASIDHSFFPTSLVLLLPFVTLMLVADNYWKIKDSVPSLTLLLQMHKLCSRSALDERPYILASYDMKVLNILDKCSFHSIRGLAQDVISNSQEDVLNMIKQRSRSNS